MADIIGEVFTVSLPPHWIVEWEVTGFNGAWGLWVNERWKWPSGGTHHVQPRSLSYEESCRLVQLGGLFVQGPLWQNVVDGDEAKGGA